MWPSHSENKQEVDRGYLLECGGPRIPGQGTMSLKRKLSLMSSPTPTLLSPGFPRVGRCQSLLEHGRVADLGWGRPSEGHRLLGEAREAGVTQPPPAQRRHWPGMQGHPEAALIALPERLEQPGSCRLSIQMGSKSAARLSPGVVGTQLGSRPTLQPSSPSPGASASRAHGPSALRGTLPQAPGPAGHLAWLASAQRCHSLGNSVGQTGLGLKSDSLGLEAWPQFPHLENGS